MTAEEITDDNVMENEKREKRDGECDGSDLKE